jgi:hypothetical protein
MDNCTQCSNITTLFDTIGKTYYRLDEETVLCYRHWHQLNRPKAYDKGEHYQIFSKQSIAKVNDAKEKEARETKDEKKHKAPERIWDGL